MSGPLRWVTPDPAPPFRPPPVDLSEREARNVLAATLDALRWARAYREYAHRNGPTEGIPGERWDWYRQGSTAAADHDRACVEEELRRVLGLPDWETDYHRSTPPDPSR